MEVAVDVALKAKQRGNAHMEKREYRQAFVGGVLLVYVR